MTRIAPAPYVAVTVPRKITFAKGYSVRFSSDEMAYNLDAPPSAIIESACDPDALAILSAYTARQVQSGEPRGEDALYVISVDGLPVCKIGYSFYPAKRLIELQQQTWCDLRLSAVFYPLNWKADRLERAVLDKAKELDLIIRGEWLNVSAEDAVALIAKIAKGKKKLLAGSDTYFDNLASRTAGLQAAHEQRHQDWRRRQDEFLRAA